MHSVIGAKRSLIHLQAAPGRPPFTNTTPEKTHQATGVIATNIKDMYLALNIIGFHSLELSSGQYRPLGQMLGAIKLPEQPLRA